MNKTVKDQVIKAYGELIADKYVAFKDASEKAMKALYEEVQTPKVMNQLFDEIRRRLGLQISFTFEPYTDTKNKYPYKMKISSEDLADKTMLIRSFCKKFYMKDDYATISEEIQNVSGNKLNYYGSNIDCINYDIPAIPIFYVNMDYRYIHSDGGSNGHRVLHAIYKEGKWKFDWLMDNERED